jgi:hypothetical protein
MLYEISCGISISKNRFRKYVNLDHGIFQGDRNKIGTEIHFRIGYFWIRMIIKGHHFKVPGCRQCIKQENNS